MRNDYERISEKADVWSAAMVIYEILSGKVPFDDPAATAAGIMPGLDLFDRELKNGRRPELPAHIMEDESLAWIADMVGGGYRFVSCAYIACAHSVV